MFEYQPAVDQSACLSCPFAVKPEFAAVACVSQRITASQDVSFLYYILVVMFSCMAAAAAVIIIFLLRSRHTIFRHPGHIGIFLYFIFFIPYAALEASSLGQLAVLSSSDLDYAARASAEISSSAAFAAFFGVGFITKVVILQMWSHIVKLHISSTSTPNSNLQNLLRFTYKSFVWAVVTTVTTYVVGFGVLTSEYITITGECVKQQDSECTDRAQVLQQPCVQSQKSKNNLDLYEGVWAVTVLVVFTLLSLFFKGLVFGMYVCAHRGYIACLMLCRLTEELALTSRQLMLVHSKALWWVSRPLLPAAWTPGEFKTSDAIEEQRVKLELLANRIFRMQVFSFVCKTVSVASLLYAPDIDATQRSIIFSFTVLTVQALPNALTLLLLSRYFFNCGGTRVGSATAMNAFAHSQESAENCMIDDSVTIFSVEQIP